MGESKSETFKWFRLLMVPAFTWLGTLLHRDLVIFLLRNGATGGVYQDLPDILWQERQSIEFDGSSFPEGVVAGGD